MEKLWEDFIAQQKLINQVQKKSFSRFAQGDRIAATTFKAVATAPKQLPTALDIEAREAIARWRANGPYDKIAGPFGSVLEEIRIIMEDFRPMIRF